MPRSVASVAFVFFVVPALAFACGGSAGPEPARPFAGPGPAAASAPDGGSDPAAAARAFVETLARHEWQAATLALDASLRAPTSGPGATAKTLETFWSAIEGQGQGPAQARATFTGIEGVALGRRGTLDVALLVCRFGDKLRVVRLSLTPEQRVAGLFQGTTLELAEPDARTFVEALAAHEVAAAHAMLAPALRSQVSEQELAAMWGAVEKQLGPFKAIERVEVTASPETRATVTVRFASGARGVLLGFGETADVIGLKIVPAPAAWEPPSYAKPSAFTETSVVLGTAQLRGLVTMPNSASAASGAAKVPGVVLVHRDGPQDEDESLGANRPFKDLAWGLASRGVAVLRYRKRLVADIPGEATEKQEVLEPALAAIDALKATPGVDPARVVVVGHGRGGALAPILARDAKLKGAALLAAPTRGLAENIVEQLTYLASLDPDNADLKSQLEGWKKLRKKIEEPSLDRGAKIALPSGGALSGAYFVTARELAPVQAAATFPGALFLAQGGRDFQVAPAQLGEWQKALAKAPKATFKTYPTLGHLFTASAATGKPSPSDYGGAGHVDEQLVADLAGWIAKL
jgi:dienelactone hydrolase